MKKKYEVLASWILDEIENGTLRYQERIPSEKDLAE